MVAQGPSLARSVRLEAYLNRSPGSHRERTMVFEMLGLVPRLVVAELGNVADDSILWQVSRQSLLTKSAKC